MVKFAPRLTKDGEKSSEFFFFGGNLYESKIGTLGNLPFPRK